MARHRYRYITNGSCELNARISSFRLASHIEISRCTLYAGKTFWRVEIPEDMQLVKYSCDNYSTTDDQRLIRELSPVRIIISWNGKWRHLPLDCDAETEWRREHEKWVKSLHELGEKAYRPLCDN